MSWVKAHAYDSRQFVFGKLLKQVKADIKEAKQLPEDAWNSCQLSLNETGETSARVDLISDQGPVFLARFAVARRLRSSVHPVQDLGREHRRHLSLRARRDQELQAEVWFVNEDEKTRYAVEDITEMIFEPVTFITSR